MWALHRISLQPPVSKLAGLFVRKQNLNNKKQTEILERASQHRIGECQRYLFEPERPSKGKPKYAHLNVPHNMGDLTPRCSFDLLLKSHIMDYKVTTALAEEKSKGDGSFEKFNLDLHFRISMQAGQKGRTQHRKTTTPIR